MKTSTAQHKRKEKSFSLHLRLLETRLKELNESVSFSNLHAYTLVPFIFNRRALILGFLLLSLESPYAMLILAFHLFSLEGPLYLDSFCFH